MDAGADYGGAGSGYGTGKGQGREYFSFLLNSSLSSFLIINKNPCTLSYHYSIITLYLSKEDFTICHYINETYLPRPYDIMCPTPFTILYNYPILYLRFIPFIFKSKTNTPIFLIKKGST